MALPSIAALIGSAALSLVVDAGNEYADDLNSWVNAPCGADYICQSNVCGTAYGACCRDGTTSAGKTSVLGSSCTSKLDCCQWDCDPTILGAGHNLCCTPGGTCPGSPGLACVPVLGVCATDGTGSPCCGSQVCLGTGSSGFCYQTVQGPCSIEEQCASGLTCTNGGDGGTFYPGTCQVKLHGPGNRCSMDQDCAYHEGLGCVDAGGTTYCDYIIGSPPDNPCPQGQADCLKGQTCVAGVCEDTCLNDGDCVTFDPPYTRCEGTCCGTLHQECISTSDCCPEGAGTFDGGSSVTCGADGQPGISTCCVWDGGACGQTSDCCQPQSISGAYYQVMACDTGTYGSTCQPCTRVGAGAASNAQCCSGTRNEPTNNICCFEPGVKGCNLASDCCTPPGPGPISMLCGGTGILPPFNQTTLDGEGVCCEEQGSTCNSASSCCDGYCQLNAIPDAGICHYLDRSFPSTVCAQ